MKPQEITPYQLWTSLIGSMLVRSFYTFPRAAALTASTAAPWAVLAAGAAAFLLFWPVAAALARRPGQNLIDLALAAGGRPLAIGVALPVAALLIGGTGIGLRQAAEMAVTGFFPHTPQTFAMASLIAAGALGAAMSPAGLVWIGAVSAWPALAALLLVLLGNLAWGQFRNVLPPAGPGLLPVAGELLPLTSYYGELVFAAVVSRYLTAPRHLVRAAGQAVAVSALTGAAMVLVYLMVFPLPGGLTVPFPLLEMTRLVMGGRFLERVDALWIGLWTLGSAGLAAGALQTAALLFRDAFRLPDHRGAVLPLAVAVLATALFPGNQENAVAMETFVVRRWGFLLTLVLPLLVALLARVRRRSAGAGAGAGAGGAVRGPGGGARA